MADKMLAHKRRYVVGRNDRTGRRRWFPTEKQAAAYLGRLKNQTDVINGCYYLDGPCKPKVAR